MNHELAECMAKDLMRQHGLIGAGWQFEWSNSKRCFGKCIFGRRTIQLSRWLTGCNPSHEVRDTILHEIAHYFTPGHGHDAIWKRKCIAIGARPKARFNEREVVYVKSKYSLFCDCCKKVIKKTNKLLSKADLSQTYHKSCGPQSAGKLKLLRNL